MITKKRSTAAIAVAATVAVALVGCAAGTEEATDSASIVVVDGGGSYHDASIDTIYPAFTEATGISVVAATYDYSLGSIKAQVEGAKEWDIVVVGSVPNEQQQELFLPIDKSVVTGEGLPDGSVGDYLVGYSSTGIQVTSRADKFDSAPQTWADVWDCATFPGTRQMMNSAAATLEVALLADGVAANDLYPLDVDRALTKLDDLVENCDVVWYATGADQVQNFSTGVAVTGMGWNGRTAEAVEQGIPLTASMMGTLLAPARLGVLKTSTSPEAAMQYLQWLTSPEGNAVDATAFPGEVPVNPGAFEFIPAELAATLPSNPEYADDIAEFDQSFWDDNFDAINAAWAAWYSALS